MSVKDRGFASMDKEKQRAIASLGGKAAHAQGTAHEWDTDSARAAGWRSNINRARTKAKPSVEPVTDFETGVPQPVDAD